MALIERFELKGASAAAVERVFAQPASVRDTLSVLGALLLVVSGLSFCRALQRLYERTWRLPALGIRATPAHLRWIAVVIAYVAVMGAVNAVVSEWFGTGAKVAIGLAGGFLLWLLTPFLLLGRRVAPRALLWTALLTSVSMSALSAASVLYMPRSIASSAERFGPIGIAISLVSWLIAAGLVLAVAAVVGAILAERSATGHAGSSERPLTPGGRGLTGTLEGQIHPHAPTLDGQGA